jgi:uncharacterized protein (TIGR02246 family)
LPRSAQRALRASSVERAWKQRQDVLMSEPAIADLYRRLLRCWNEKNAAAYGALFTDDGVIIGFDGTCVESQAAISHHLQSIFADHDPASYVAIIEDVRPVGAGVAVLRGVAGMVPPGSDTIKPEVNAQQTVLAVDTDDGWKIVLFQNTPARFDGRPADVASMTRALQAAHDTARGSAG